jgi:tetratricopeptide (TPR) repeat protein
MSQRPAAILLVLCACAGASPDPKDMAATELAHHDVSPAEAEKMAKAIADAQVALVARRFATAEELALRAIEIDPRAARARAIYGLCLLQRAMARQPSDMYLQNRGDGETLRAVALAPADPVVGRLRGEFLAQVGHLSAAAAAAESALGAAVDDGSAERAALLALAGEWRYELGEERAALPHLLRLVELRPDDATGHFRLGFCLLRTADKPALAIDAAKAFARCAELSPGDQDAHLAIGRAHLRAAELSTADAATREQELTAAMAAFDAACARFATAAEPRFCRGSVFEAMGEGGRAAAAYQDALALDANHIGALLELAALHVASGDADRRVEAETMLRRALALAEGRPAMLSPRERQRIEKFLAAGKDQPKAK